MKKKLVSWVIFVVVVLIAWTVAGPTTLGGPAAFVIVDGRSMEPTYSSGDLVIAYERDAYEVGDVIVYDAPVDHQFNVIHRVTRPTDGGFVTQGDNMDREDGWIAPRDEIYGAALFHIPKGGLVLEFLRQPAAILALLAGFIVFSYMSHQEKRRATDKQGVKAADEREPELLA